MSNQSLIYADMIDALNDQIGKALGWVVLLLILVQITLILMSGVFHLGSIKLQESLLYLNSLMFLAGAGYGLLHDEHVRVDIFYREMPAHKKAWVNLAGTVGLLFPFLTMLAIYGFNFASESWRMLEGSIDISGLPFVYLLKSFILLFVITVGLQGISVIFRATHTIQHRKTEDQ